MGMLGLVDAASASYWIIAMIFLFVINFAYSWGPMVWVVCAEIFPLRHRSRCVGLTTMSGAHFLCRDLRVEVELGGQLLDSAADAST